MVEGGAPRWPLPVEPKEGSTTAGVRLVKSHGLVQCSTYREGKNFTCPAPLLSQLSMTEGAAGPARGRFLRLLLPVPSAPHCSASFLPYGASGTSGSSLHVLLNTSMRQLPPQASVP